MIGTLLGKGAMMSLSLKQKISWLEWQMRNIFRKPYYMFVRKPYRKIQQIFGQIDFVPSGHFYSPIPNALDIKERIASLDYNPDSLVGIDLNTQIQLEFLDAFSKFYNEMPFTQKGEEGLRYRLDNGYFAHGDGVVLYSFMRHLEPKNIIEIGSGFSSALMHDVNEIFFSSRGGGDKYYPYRAISQ